ncbi:MAG: LamG domain-containing protein [Labilithrix sp.]|nr:LamG domain-containing protein [Labilithrix sp.]
MSSRVAQLLATILSGAGCSLFMLDEGELSGGRGAPSAEGDADVADISPSEAGISEPDSAVEAPSRYASAILADEPTLYWRLGESAGTIAKAAVGADGAYSVAGIALGAPGVIAGDPDTAVTFTDGAGRIELDTGASFDGLAPFSVEVWVKPSPANPALGFVFDHTHWGEAGARRGWDILVGNATTNFERWASVDEKSSAGSAAMSVGQWHHLVGTFDGATMRLYADATRIAERGTSVELPARTSALTIGHQGCDCSAVNSFIGDLDELAVYDKALTDAQIAAHYAAAR